MIIILHVLNKQFSLLKEINNFTAHLGGREEIQLNSLIAARVIFPVDLGFHPQQKWYTAEMTKYCSKLICILISR